jgi:hypothetical protein
MVMIKQAHLSGPVQGASWDAALNGWRVAGWREEVIISQAIVDRRETTELPVHIVPDKDGALVLYNDGSWDRSPFTTPKQDV